MSGDALKSPSQNARRTASICGALLLISAVLSYAATMRESPTVDEPLHAAAGYAIRWLGDYRIDVEDPALFPLVSTLPQRQSDLHLDAADPGLMRILADHNAQWPLLVRMMFRTPRTDASGSAGEVDVYSGTAYIDRARLMFVGLNVLLGVLLARWGISALAMLGPKDLPRLDAIAIDPAVLSFAVAAGMLTAVLCGIVPALRASRTDVMEVLRQSGGRASGLRGGRRLRSGVVIAEVALSFVLLIGAGLMVRSFIALGRMDPGFDPENVLTFVAQAPLPQAAQREAFKQRLRERLLRIPGVVAATAAGPLPLDGGVSSGRWGTAAALSDPASYRQATFHIITPGYFEALRTRIIAGRGFTAADNHVDPVTSMPKQIVIDSLLAARAFPNQSAVGQRLLARIITPEAEWFEVIGVVEHQRHISLADDGPDAIYFADGYVGHGGAGRWAVRTTADPLQSWTAIRAAIAEVNPRTVTAEVQPMRAFVDKAMAPLRFTMTLVGVFAGIAAALAAIGLYGVLATIVRQRTAEIGMRLVFGAPRASILKLVVGEGMKLSAIGMATGIVAALALTRVMASLVVGVSPVDPATFAGIAALFAVVALAAAWAPAYRASRLDPMTAIREE
jgi:putative ABC transport system permease protein